MKTAKLGICNVLELYYRRFRADFARFFSRNPPLFHIRNCLFIVSAENKSYQTHQKEVVLIVLVHMVLED